MRETALVPQAPRPLHAYSLLRENCLCPLTLEVMRDPVIAADGNTYERSAIQQLFRNARQAGQMAKSPVTREPFAHSSLLVNHAMRSSIGQLPDSDLLPAGAALRDAFTDAAVSGTRGAHPGRAAVRDAFNAGSALGNAAHLAGNPLRAASSNHSVPGTPAAHAARALPPRPENAAPADVVPLTRQAAYARLDLVAPAQQGMGREPIFCSALLVARQRIASTRQAIESTLAGAEPPVAFLHDYRTQRAQKAACAATTCGASYLCSKAGRADSSAATCAYCVGGAAIGSMACPVFAGPVLVDFLCCDSLVTMCTLGCLGACGRVCAGDPQQGDVMRAYAHKLVQAWSNGATSAFGEFGNDARDAVFYKRELDQRPGAGGGFIITLRREAIAHQQAYVRALSEFADWCAAQGLSQETCQLVHGHLAKLRQGTAYREPTLSAL